MSEIKTDYSLLSVTKKAETFSVRRAILDFFPELQLILNLFL